MVTYLDPAGSELRHEHLEAIKGVFVGYCRRTGPEYVGNFKMTSKERELVREFFESLFPDGIAGCCVPEAIQGIAA